MAVHGGLAPWGVERGTMEGVTANSGANGV